MKYDYYVLVDEFQATYSIKDILLQFFIKYVTVDFVITIRLKPHVSLKKAFNIVRNDRQT